MPKAHVQIDVINKKIGKRIKQIREGMDLSQTQMANKVNISFQQIQKYENGSNKLSLARTILLAKKLKIPASRFIVD